MKTNAKHNLKPLSSVLKDLRSQGFTTDFRLDKNSLVPLQYPTRKYRSEEITILDQYRFEGDTDPADASILYVLETDDGLKGTISNSYGPAADTTIEDFLNHTKEVR